MSALTHLAAATELPAGLLLAGGLLLGLLFGSFLNVVVWRLPRGESVAWPGSCCPACGPRRVPPTTCRCWAGCCCAVAAATAPRPSAPATRWWNWPAV
ncbi:MAG: prepilin peptidase [bacterium]|nr:prepilin peptidase [bacterium]